jgi:hypothetical protein
MWQKNVYMWHELRMYDFVHKFIGFVGSAVEHSFVYSLGCFVKWNPVGKRKSIWDICNFVSSVFHSAVYVRT